MSVKSILKISYLVTNLLFIQNTLLAQTKTIGINYASPNGNFKDLTGVNLGPNTGSSTASLCYQNIGVSAVRTHDYRGPCDYQAYSKFYQSGTFNYTYQPWVGGPGNYNWTNTNTQINNIINANSIPFFRLGISFPISGNTPATPMPKDADNTNFKIFAGICKRTAMHYTGSWDNGYNFSIPYWEVWNEPNHALSWTVDSVKAYYRMYKQVRDSIKSFNPNLKVGGPATASNAFYPTIRPEYIKSFFRFLDSTGTGIDFYSFHSYEHTNPWNFKNIADTIRYFATQNNITIPEIIVSEAGIDMSNNSGYQNSPLGCAYLSSVLLTADIANISKVLWYSGVSLGALCEADTLGAPRLKWNAYAYKMYHQLFQETNQKLGVSGLEYVSNNFSANTNLLFAAGKSSTGDTVNIMISNLNSAWTQFDVTIQNLPWSSSDDVDITITTVATGKAYTAENKKMKGAATMVVPITGITNQSVYLVKMVRKNGLSNLSDLRNYDLEIYPNPIKDQLHIKGNEAIQELQLLNSQGQTLQHQTFAIPSNEITWPVNGLQSGCYWMRIVSNGNSTVKRLVVE